ncbi:MAG: sialate O-acetylesterase [Verrucomicrobiota bacterium]
MRNSTRIFIAIVAALATRAAADVKLPAIFSNHMVLQAGVNAPVWGWADAGEEVTVTIAGQTKKVTAGKDGKWMVKLDVLKTGEPVTLTVKGKNSIEIADVLVGDVWLCSGQSNMAMNVKDAKDFEKVKTAADFPNIRTFTSAWTVCSSNTVGSFSATAYFFGREIHQKTGAPIGLINASVGGTPIEAWTSLEAQLAQLRIKLEIDSRAQDLARNQAAWNPEQVQADYEKQLATWKEAATKAKAEGKPEPRQPVKPIEPRLRPDPRAGLFNSKIAPLIPYALRGAIWYQGEANASAGKLYGLQLATLIQDWRTRWNNEFPFAWVQLPEYTAAQTVPVEDSGWALVREGMLQTLKLPHTGMAIALGTGEASNIHPKNKQEVGHRLASWALATVYGHKDVVWSGPLPAGHKITGNEVVLSFTHTDGELVAKGGELKGFAIAGADKKWIWANAKMAGDTVIVSHPDVKEPVAVRYAWAHNPAGANLYNGAGLPASPFRTDAP